MSGPSPFFIVFLAALAVPRAEIVTVRSIPGTIGAKIFHCRSCTDGNCTYDQGPPGDDGHFCDPKNWTETTTSFHCSCDAVAGASLVPGALVEGGCSTFVDDVATTGVCEGYPVPNKNCTVKPTGRVVTQFANAYCPPGYKIKTNWTSIESAGASGGRSERLAFNNQYINCVTHTVCEESS